ncbi:hypothetical protein Kim5_CH02913 [Rhizobium sp. Kim5]|nr:hypothetical protein Kim5_CH02913 [Rhizobium sp. Kim5]
MRAECQAGCLCVYPMQIMTAAWAGMVIDIDDHFDAWQVNWKRASIRSPFDDTRLTQIG